MVSKLAILQPQFFFGFVCLHFVQVMYDFLFLFSFLRDFFFKQNVPWEITFNSGNQITYNHIVDH